LVGRALRSQPRGNARRQGIQYQRLIREAIEREVAR
jgi:predicted DNA binding CopG/RHH family protein